MDGHITKPLTAALEQRTRSSFICVACRDGTTMSNTKYIGRVGGLAVALGVGVAVARHRGWRGPTISGRRVLGGAPARRALAAAGNSESEGTATSTGTTTEPTGTSTASGSQATAPPRRGLVR